MLSERDFLILQNGSDVRGVAVEGVDDETVNFSTEAVNRISSGFVKFLSEKLGKAPADLTIAIGNDSRISAPPLKNAAIKAFSANGVKTLDCGLATTPSMFMSIIFDESRADGSIMITASHLPSNRNGMKFFTKDGGLDNLEVKEVLTLAAQVEEVDAPIDNVEEFNLVELYSAHMRKIICETLGEGDQPLKGVKILVDAGNGDSGFVVKKILDPLGADTTGSQYLEPDGTFPHHIPNPEDRKAMASIRKAVVDNNADLGLIFDTDVDRMGAVLSDGQEINRNALIAMIAAIIAPDYPGSTIVTDSVTSDGLHKFLENELHLKHHRFKRGYKNVINECIRLNKSGIVSPLAIETSGHGALSENYYLDDGAYMAVKLLIAAAKAHKDGRNLASLIEKLEHPAEAVEYRLKIKNENFKDYGDKVLKEFTARARSDGIKFAEPNFEGVRLIFDEGWALLRLSLHDPNMPLNIESNVKGGCEKIAAKVKNLLKGFDALEF